MQKQSKKTKENLREEKGITLVALVVMIIILLILGGITIGAINGNDGVISKTLNTKKQVDVQNGIEIIKAAIIECNTLKPNSKMQASDLEEALSDYDVEVTPRGNNYKITLNGIGYRILPDGEVIQYDYIEPTGICYKLEEDGTLRLKANDESYMQGTEWDKVSVIKVIIEEPIAPTTTRAWFSGCINLENIEKIENLHTDNITDMTNMFYNCIKLQKLDINAWDTTKVSIMYQTFRDCKKIEALDVSNLFLDNVSNFKHMFSGCEMLKELKVCRKANAKAATMDSMFRGCTNIVKINLEDFYTNNVYNMDYMFQGCQKINKLNLTNFNTENVKSMYAMFGDCNELTELNLDTFNTSNVEDMGSMFARCTKLNKIYTSGLFDVSKVTRSTQMFYQCTNLVGGKGTVYDSSKIDIDYARIDNPPDEPGYFTLKK